MRLASVIGVSKSNYIFTKQRIAHLADLLALEWLWNQRHLFQRGGQLYKLSTLPIGIGSSMLTDESNYNAFDDKNGQRAYLKIREKAVNVILYKVKYCSERYSDIATMFPPNNVA